MVQVEKVDNFTYKFYQRQQSDNGKHIQEDLLATISTNPGTGSLWFLEIPGSPKVEIKSKNLKEQLRALILDKYSSEQFGVLSIEDYRQTAFPEVEEVVTEMSPHHNGHSGHDGHNGHENGRRPKEARETVVFDVSAAN